MIRKVILFIIFFVAFTTISNAQHTFFKGNIPQFKNTTVRVFKYSDLITMNQEKVINVNIDTVGNFQFKVLNYSTNIFIFRFGYYTAMMYAEPNKKYNLKFLNNLNNFDTEKINTFLKPIYLDFEIQNSDSNELNQLINKFNNSYDNFLGENFKTLRFNRNKKLLDSFVFATNKMFEHFSNEYFINYRTYRIAQLEKLTQITSSEKLFVKYIYNKPILYDNTEYMAFFNEYFEGFISSYSKRLDKNIILDCVFKQKSYKAITDSLGRDSILQNEVVRDLALIKYLDELYHRINYDRRDILNLLEQIATNSKFEKHRQIARNIINIKNKLRPGTMAPDFEVFDADNKPISLKDFRGKLVYISFYKSSYIPTTEEFNLTKKLNEDFPDGLKILSISADKDLEQTKTFAKKNNYNWTFANFDNNFDLLDNYGIKTFPTFVLIDREGRIIKCPAAKPSQNIGEFISKYISASSKNLENDSPFIQKDFLKNKKSNKKK